jgi:hypothetical protein
MHLRVIRQAMIQDWKSLIANSHSATIRLLLKQRQIRGRFVWLPQIEECVDAGSQKCIQALTGLLFFFVPRIFACQKSIRQDPV